MMEALRINALSMYRIDIELMNILFTELKISTLVKPEDPKEKITTDLEGRSIKSISRLEETIYSERVKNGSGMREA